MTESEFEGEPVIRDKRRIDPTTGEARPASGGAVETDGATGAAGATGPGNAPEGAAGTEGTGTDEEVAEDPVAAAKAEAADLFDQVQRAKAELYNQEQRFNAYVRRARAEAEAAKLRGAEAVVEALIPVLDDVAAAREHGELSGPFAAIAEKLESTLDTQFGAVRFGAIGEAFDPNVHEALMHNQSSEVQVDTIDTVLQPGYRVGERVVRPARVSVTGPE